MNILTTLLLLASLAILTLSNPIIHNNTTIHNARRGLPPQKASRERRGIAFNDVSVLPLFVGKGAMVTWTYNWDSIAPPSSAWFRFIPMLHSLRDDLAGRWRDNAETRAFENWRKGEMPTWLLGFNEPDNCMAGAGGSCISVSDAVAGWKKHMEPLSTLTPKLYLGSPAVTNAFATPTSGLGWLSAFMKACTGCTIDFINLHWYDRASNVDYFKAHINEARKIAGGRPIWITEFRAAGSDEEVVRFLDEVMPWMDASSDIHRYAYFMARPGAGMLVNGQGNGLSVIGREFDYFYR
ncbi:hypothetical protein BDW02DRAFT_601217 [Decorospora gaudefroyi]|uniref:Asl1-like glycosyl hydrolase catalytic domain-containing protein n=1 Tax=Decorospora gaudefroyi TaxID=184978 RepID=A0A6A5K2C7_9PLEO|nr:hypothetical protein BDW02DRAFT_601217 [Decorospora gaudefroyi]